MRTYILRPFHDGQQGGYGVVWSRRSGAQRVWFRFRAAAAFRFGQLCSVMAVFFTSHHLVPS
jgi:hypothetical protein